MEPPVVMGVGAWAAIRASRVGTVIAAFDKAVYVRFPGGVVALTTSSVAAGPLHLRVSVDLGPQQPGALFVVPQDWMEKGRVWRGALPEPSTVAAELLLPVAERSALLTEPYLGRWEQATGTNDLAELCPLLGGLGPGLTPSGDDALAGILLAARIRHPESEEQLVALAAGVDTHEIARAFLLWAARGQSIEPVHRLLAGDATAAADLLAWGHTSGADLALGLHHGLVRQGLGGSWPRVVSPRVR